MTFPMVQQPPASQRYKLAKATTSPPSSTTIESERCARYLLQRRWNQRVFCFREQKKQLVFALRKAANDLNDCLGYRAMGQRHVLAVELFDIHIVHNPIDCWSRRPPFESHALVHWQSYLHYLTCMKGEDRSSITICTF